MYRILVNTRTCRVYSTLPSKLDVIVLIVEINSGKHKLQISKR
jgi:hypothetical protein